MTYNPESHRRRSIRLRDFDYTRPGVYFVTICAFQRECLFGDVVDGLVLLNDMGHAVQECFDAIPNHFPQVDLDEFVVMPNHVHGIIVRPDDGDRVGARHASPGFGVPGSGARAPQARATHASPLQVPGPKPRSVGAIVGSFKSAVTRRINAMCENPGAPIWQRNYYEHVIRDETDLHVIRQYIADNPVKWVEDENHPAKW